MQSRKDPTEFFVMMRSIIRFARLLALAMACAPASGPAIAQVPTANPDFDLLAAGDVRAVVRQADGRLIIGGSFTRVGGLARRSLARLLPDGRVDPSFDVDVDGLVTSLVLDQSTGALFVAGDFAQVGGIARDGVARIALASDPAVDPLWGPALVSGSGTRRINAMVSDGSGGVVVGGTFTSLGGVAIQNLARLTGATGQVESGWRPEPGNEVLSLALDPVNGLYVGGLFSQISGTARLRLARLVLASGTLDPGFAPTYAGLPPIALVVDPTSGGVALTARQGVLASNIENVGSYLNRLSSNGSLVDGAACDCTMSAIAFDGPDVVFTGSILSRTGFRQPVSGRLRPGTGSFELNPGWPAARLAGIGRFIQVDGPHVVMAGTLASTTTARFGVLRVHASSGAIDESFSASVLRPGEASASVVTATGKAVVGGDFVVAGDSVRRNLLRLDTDGSLDANWQIAADGAVRALLLDQLGRLVVGGEFNELAGQPIRRLGRLTGAEHDILDPALNPPGVRLLGDVVYLPYVLALASSENWLYVASARFQPNFEGYFEVSRIGGSGAFERGWARRFQYPVTRLLADGDEQVLLVEQVPQAVPTTPPFPYPPSQIIQRVYTSSGTRTADAVTAAGTWGPQFEWPSNVADLHRDASGGVLVAGNLWPAGATTSSPLLRLSSIGEPVAGWQAPADGSAGTAVTSDAAGSVYLDRRIAGLPPRIRRYGSDGTVDPDWDVEHDAVAPLRLLPTGSALLVAGDLRQIAGSEHAGIARLATDLAPLLADGFE